MTRAVVLLSGGLDSTTAAALARREGWELYGLTLRYGQVHARELEAARRVAAALGFVRHVELDVDLRAFGGSSLVGDGAIPKDRALDDRSSPIAQSPNCPIAQFRRPTSPRATPSFCRSRWRGPRCSAPSASSSA